MLISKSDDSKSAATSSQANLDTPNNINSQPHVPSAPSLAFISPHSGNSPDSDPTMKQYWSRIYQWLPEIVINKDESELKDILASEEEMLELQLKSPVTAHMNQQIQSVSVLLCATPASSHTRHYVYLHICMYLYSPFRTSSSLYVICDWRYSTCFEPHWFNMLKFDIFFRVFSTDSP